MQIEPATLTILRQQQSYIFQLQGTGDRQPVAIVGATEASEEHFSAQVAQRVQLLNQLLDQRRGPNGAAWSAGDAPEGDPLRSLGRIIYNQLFPVAIQRTLRTLAPGSPLFITTNAPELPWELAHDDSEYLALQYATSRQMLLPQAPRQNQLRRDPRWSALLIGNPTGNLPETDLEIERLARLIESTPGTASPRILMRGRATRETVLQEIASGLYDLIHYAGHATFDAQKANQSGLVLAKEQLLTAQEIQQNLGGQPFVFLNSCESARLAASTHEHNRNYLGSELAGMATAFLLGGAGGFLGAFWPLHDRGSATFALNFYRAALQGDSAAEALRNARLQVRHSNVLDPQWAAFTLYAHPSRTLAMPAPLQRRPATILAACLHDVDALFAARPGEEAATLVNEVLTALAQRVARYGGQGQIFAPELFVGSFGARVVHHNDPERAVRAALEMVAELAAQNPEQLPFKLGFGLSSGDIYLKAATGEGQPLPTLLGEPFGQAIQLARQASSNTILITPAVQESIEQGFDVVPVAVAGLPAVFQVLGVAHDPVQQAARSGRQTLLAGRTNELEQLQALWRQCSQGRGQLVGIAGEAGVGKSRLLHELRQRLQHEPQHWLMAVCPSAYQPGPYEVIAQVLRALLPLPPAEATAGNRGETALAQLEQVVHELPGLSTQHLPETLALLCDVLALPGPAVSLAHLDAAARQRRLAELLGRLLAQSAAIAPVVLVLEDLHWADEASLEVLAHLLARSERLPLLVIALFRPDQAWQPPWWNRRNYHQMNLDTLDEAASRTLLGALLETPEPPAEVAQVVLARSNGNPLFLRELVAALCESGTLRRQGQSWQLVRPLRSDEIPATVHRVLLARVERLPAATQRVLALAAVISDEVEQSLLQSITADSRDELGLERALAELEMRDFLIRQWDETSYHFSHALVREVVYNQLSLEERQRYHRRVGEAVEVLPDANIERLAHHFYQSLSIAQGAEPAAARAADQETRQKAVLYLIQAGQRAGAKYAAHAALRHFQQALPIAQALPDSTALLIDLYDGMASAYQTLTELDSAIAQFVQAYSLLTGDTQGASRRRAAELARRIGRLYEWKSEYHTAFEWLQQGLAQLSGLEEAGGQAIAAALHIRIGSVYYNQGNLEAAVEACNRGVKLAENLDQPTLQAEAHNLLGIVYDVQGRSAFALDHYARSLALWQRLGDEYQTARVEDNIGLASLYAGNWHMAQEYLQRGYTFWTRIEDQYNLAIACLNLGLVALYQGDWSPARAYFDQALARWEKTKNQRWIALCHTNLGLLAIAQEAWTEAENHLLYSRDLLLQHNIRDLLPETYYALAEAALGQAQNHEALPLARQAIDLAAEQGMQLEEGIGWRVLGKALQAQGLIAESSSALERSLLLLQQLNNRYEVGRTLVQLAAIYLLVGKAAEATNARQQASAIFRELGAQADLQTLPLL